MIKFCPYILLFFLLFSYGMGAVIPAYILDNIKELLDNRDEVSLNNFLSDATPESRDEIANTIIREAIVRKDIALVQWVLDHIPLTITMADYLKGFALQGGNPIAPLLLAWNQRQLQYEEACKVQKERALRRKIKKQEMLRAQHIERDRQIREQLLIGRKQEREALKAQKEFNYRQAHEQMLQEEMFRRKDFMEQQIEQDRQEREQLLQEERQSGEPLIPKKLSEKLFKKYEHRGFKGRLIDALINDENVDRWFKHLSRIHVTFGDNLEDFILFIELIIKRKTSLTKELREKLVNLLNRLKDERTEQDAKLARFKREWEEGKAQATLGKRSELPHGREESAPRKRPEGDMPRSSSPHLTEFPAVPPAEPVEFGFASEELGEINWFPRTPGTDMGTDVARYFLPVDSAVDPSSLQSGGNYSEPLFSQLGVLAGLAAQRTSNVPVDSESFLQAIQDANVPLINYLLDRGIIPAMVHTPGGDDALEFAEQLLSQSQSAAGASTGKEAERKEIVETLKPYFDLSSYRI